MKYLKQLMIVIACILASVLPAHASFGIASWYGPGFHGRLTASGEIFNQYAMTVAHKQLPFGTTIRITNIRNGKSVIAKVNDRGPFIKGRVLDLSKGVNNILGCNLCKVNYTVLSLGDGKYRLDKSYKVKTKKVVKKYKKATKKKTKR